MNLSMKAVLTLCLVLAAPLKDKPVQLEDATLEP